MRGQVLHPYKTTCKIIVLCVLMFIFLDRNLENRRFNMRPRLHFFENPTICTVNSYLSEGDGEIM
jgi:hypothetical protein